MSYLVELEKSCTVRPGRSAPVVPPAVPTDSFSVTLRVGIAFDEVQLTRKGWFVDTDVVAELVGRTAEYLASDAWVKLFEFKPPTFELVARWVFQYMQAKVAQLAYVELDNRTLGIKTRYEPKTQDKSFAQKG